MKKVLVIHQSAEMYGSDKVLLYIVERLERHGYKAIVMLPETGPLYAELTRVGVEVHVGEILKLSRALFTPAGILRLVRRVRTAVKRIDEILGDRKVDLVHSNTLAVLAGAIWAAIRKRPHVWHVHEIIMKPWGVGSCMAWGAALVSRFVIANSNRTRDWLASTSALARKKTLVVFNGLPDQVDNRSRSECRDMLQVPDQRLVVALVGRINRWKGHWLLVEAAKRLRGSERLDGIEFWVVGGPPPGNEHLRQLLATDIAQAGLSSYFRFFDFTSDVASIWRASDIAVVPSIEPEPFGMVALEAMRAGIPVVAAGHGGLLDIIENDETGLLFQPRSAAQLANCIGHLFNDPALRARLAEAGRRRQRAIFSIDAQVRAVADVYQRALVSAGPKNLQSVSK
jgi:glycosyltransferase involved in cell wall biosynthesis